MARLGLAALVLTLVPLLSIAAPELTEPDPKEQETLRKVQRILDETRFESMEIRKEMTLEQFLDVLDKHLPKSPKIALRIDRAAFGDQQAAVAAMVVSLPESLPKTVSVRTALEWALLKTKIKVDYRLGANEVAITTPARARYVAGYDIRPLVEKPDLGLPSDPESAANNPAARAAGIVQTLVGIIGRWNHPPTGGDREIIQILNGTRLVIRASAAEHAQIEDLLMALRRLGDVSATVQVRLYEVDDAFYTRLKNAKHISPEELERLMGVDNQPHDHLFRVLSKHPLVLAGPAVTMDNGQEASLLSRQQAVLCGPSLVQLARGDKGPQAVVEGVAFLGRISVTADRRCVRIRLVEKSTTIQAIDKVT